MASTNYYVIFAVPLAFKNEEYETRLTVGRSRGGFSFDYGGKAPGNGWVDIRIYKRGLPTAHGVRLRKSEHEDLVKILRSESAYIWGNACRRITVERTSEDVCGQMFGGYKWIIKLDEQRRMGTYECEMRLTEADVRLYLEN